MNNTHLPQQLSIFNMSEDVLEYIDTVLEPEQKKAELLENALLTDREYLGMRAEFQGPFIFASPVAMDEAFLNYVDNLFGEERAAVITTATHSGSICQDLMTENLLGDLPSSLIVRSYCASPMLYAWARAMTDKGFSVTLAEVPADEKIFHEVIQFGTKGGMRSLIDHHPEYGVRMPPGSIGHGMEWVQAVALERYKTEGGVVVKTNKGHAGMGVEIFRPTETSSAQVIIDQLNQQSKSWVLLPSVVESYIPTTMTVGGGFPNIEGMVLADGSVEVTYYCGMRVTPRGVFEGVEANDRVLPPAIAKEITRIAETLGKAYSTAGYRGYFEIDCLMGIDGNLYVSEANLRRNGGTYVRHLAKRLLGADWFTTSFLVTRLIFLPAKIDTFDQLYTLLEPILYSKERKEGIVIVSSNLLKMGKLAYLIIGASRERVKELEQELFKQLNSSPAFA